MNKKNGIKHIKAISLFCGCGGADLGLTGGFTYLDKTYGKTGIDIAHASDVNRKAVETYNLNFEHKAVIVDINHLGFSKGSAEIVMGGFPCQSFSTVNPTKSPDAKETQLFWQLASAIEQVRPPVFIAENVQGFYRLENGKYFKLAIGEFERLGYKVFDALLDASDYGVPQKRKRLVMVGVTKESGKSFIFPKPTHHEEENGKKTKVALATVIDSLVPDDPKYYFSERAVAGVKKAKPNMKRALAQDLNSQCLTITSHLAKVSLNSRDPVLLVDRDKELYRRLTPREAARIQSFPDKFVFAGTEADAYRQIGNAVPPVMMWYVAKEIVKQLF